MILSKLAVVRVRAHGDVRKEVEDTLQFLRLTRPNHCTIIEDGSSQRGMLRKAKEMVTWGPIKPSVLGELLRERGEVSGDSSITDEKIKEFTSYATIEEFSEVVCEGDTDLSDLEDLKAVFRLHAPRKGYKSVRRQFAHGGALGDRGEEINDLLMRMI